MIPLIIALWFILPIIWRKKGYKHSTKYKIFLSLFIFYIAMILSATIPLSNLYMSLKYGHVFVHGEINLIPFYTISKMLEIGGSTAIANILGNILMFLPLGFLLPLLFKKFDLWGITPIFGFMLSLLIEVTQSFSFRGADIDDVLLNTIGALIGYGIYRVITKFHPQIKLISILEKYEN